MNWDLVINSGGKPMQTGSPQAAFVMDGHLLSFVIVKSPGDTVIQLSVNCKLSPFFLSSSPVILYTL